MNNCYRFEKIIFNDPIFKEVKATYIIHLENNGRLENIKLQLKKFHTTENVYILFNKGFKNCNKSDEIKISYADLMDCYHHVFKDADKKGYEYILVLEDDFFFNKKILDKTHSFSIDTFLHKKKGQNYLYFLGCFPIIQYSLFGDHNRILFSGGTHSCIYSKSFIHNYAFDFPSKNQHWDTYMIQNCITRFKYKEILCYQLYSKTSNQNNWSMNYLEEKIFIPIYLFLLHNMLELDNKTYGYHIMEIVSKCIFWIILLNICLIFIFINMFHKKKISWSKKFSLFSFICILLFGSLVSIFTIFFLMVLIGRIIYRGF